MRRMIASMLGAGWRLAKRILKAVFRWMQTGASYEHIANA